MFRLVLHNNLNTFGSPASTTSRPTAVVLTMPGPGEPDAIQLNHVLETLSSEMIQLKSGGLVSPPHFPVGLQWILPDSTGFHWTPPDSMFGGSPYKVSGLDWIFSPVESSRIHRIFSPVGLYWTFSPVKSSGIHWTGSS